MFTRAELVLRFALNAICDDYENLSVTVGREVTSNGADCGVEIGYLEVADALLELTRRGWAKAYLVEGGLGGPRLVETELTPTVSQMEDANGAWFYITEDGMKVHMADWEFWPFDEDNNLRKDWTAPET